MPSINIPFFIFLVPLFLVNPTCILGCRPLEQPILEQEILESSTTAGKHFVLVHGTNHGAWSWYKLTTLLKSAGHNVTALDLASNGVDPRRLDDVTSFFEYVQPLTDFMASLPQGEKVIIVGHSYGGYCISLAMEYFPEKISAAVFVTAMMPNCTYPPAILGQEYSNWPSLGSSLDNVIVYDSNNQPLSILFGPEYIATMLYNHSSIEDVEIAKTLVRPTGEYLDDLSNPLLTENKYGSVTRVFIIAGDDLVIPPDFQKYMTEVNPPKEVKTINGSDHMAMISKPKELYLALQEIADTLPHFAVDC